MVQLIFLLKKLTYTGSLALFWGCYKSKNNVFVSLFFLAEAASAVSCCLLLELKLRRNIYHSGCLLTESLSYRCWLREGRTLWTSSVPTLRRQWHVELVFSEKNFLSWETATVRKSNRDFRDSDLSSVFHD